MIFTTWTKGSGIICDGESVLCLRTECCEEDIRRSLLKRRRSLSKEELKQVSFEINTHLINEIQNRDLKKIFYQSIDNEPSIEQTTELAWQKDIEVYIPKVISKEKIIINRLRKI